MKVGDYVLVVKGVHSGRKGYIIDNLFGEYKVKFITTNERYWFDEDEIKLIQGV